MKQQDGDFFWPDNGHLIHVQRKDCYVSAHVGSSQMPDSTMECIAVLEDFNRIVIELQNSGFAKHVSTKGLKLECDLLSGVVREEKTDWPSEEEINSVVLRVRMFIQNKDRVSLQNLHNIYKSHECLRDLEGNVYAVRSALNQLLNNNTFGIEYNGQSLTLRELLAGMIYSELAHLDYDKHAKFRVFFDDRSCLRPLIRFSFVQVLAQVVLALGYIRKNNEEAIRRLRGGRHKIS